MSWCNWPLSGGRSCGRSAARPFFANLVVCWQHERVFLRTLRSTLIWSSNEGDAAIVDAAREGIETFDRLKRQREQAAKEETRRATTLVYFAEREGFCKIGFSTKLKKRIKDISGGSSMIEGMTVGPVRLLATIPGGDRATEDWMHERFKHLHVGGEWFLLDDELRQFIGGLKGCVAQELKAA